MRNVSLTVPRTLADIKNTIPNHSEIANVFNNNFATVGDTAKQNIKYSHQHISENDTNWFYSINKLSKLVSIDLKNLVCWINANKILLNVKNPELVIFKSKI